MLRMLGFGFGAGVGWSAWQNATETDPASGTLRGLVVMLGLAFLLAWFGPRGRRGSAVATAVASAESRSVATAGVVVNIASNGEVRAGRGFEALDALPPPPASYVLAELVDDEQSDEDSTGVGVPTPQAERAAAPLLWRS